MPPISDVRREHRLAPFVPRVRVDAENSTEETLRKGADGLRSTGSQARLWRATALFMPSLAGVAQLVGGRVLLLKREGTNLTNRTR